MVERKEMVSLTLHLLCKLLIASRFVTIATSILCLTVALGSAMPTGDLPGAAETLHVSNEAIYLTIALFVVGFGVGPLLFAPCKFLPDA